MNIGNRNCHAWQQFLDEGLLKNSGFSTNGFVQNANLKVEKCNTGAQQIPVCINTIGDDQTSWVASLLNAYGPYARAETDIVKMSLLTKSLYCAASHVTQQLVAGAALSGGAYANNWLLATNLYADDFDVNCFKTATEQIVNNHPNLPVIFRSLTPALNANLIAELELAGFLMLPTRQVWVTDKLSNGNWRLKSDVKSDLKLETKSSENASISWLEGADFTQTHFTQAIDLYQDLYRVKYPKFNPDYTNHFLKCGVETGFLQLSGLLNTQTNQLIGMVGIINLDGVFATPVLGYDRALPSASGIYRRLMLKAFLTTEAAGGILHCSGGAGSFKRNRGASFYTEFAAIWPHHLPYWRKPFIGIINQIAKKIALPYLQKNAL
jgi:hypothetical protein